MNLTTLTPKTEEEMAPFKPVINSLVSWLPDSYQGTEEALASMVGDLTIIYWENLLIGAIAIEMHKKTAEIHGVANPDLRMLLGRHAATRLIDEIGTRMLEVVFMQERKRAAIAKVAPDSLGGIGFMRKWGFKGISDGEGGVKMDDGRRVYKLTREEFLRGYGKKESIKSKGKNGHITV